MSEITNYISQITLPSGNTYEIKDTTAREAISSLTSGGTFVIAWAGTSDPSSAEARGKIPAGVIVKYGSNDARTGTLAAGVDTLGKFYLVKAPSLSTNADELDIFDEYITIDNGQSANPRYTWEKIGDTLIKLSAMVTGVTLNKLTSTVIGNDASFTVTLPTITVTPTTTYIKTSPTTLKLSTTSIYGVKTGNDSTTTASHATSADPQTTLNGDSASSTANTDWLKGISVSNETLTISAATFTTQSTPQFTFTDVTVPIRADNATTVATGSLANSDTNGGTILTSVALDTDESSATGRVQVATGITSATATNGNVTWNSKDSLTVLNNSTDLTVSHPN